MDQVPYSRVFLGENRRVALVPADVAAEAKLPQSVRTTHAVERDRIDAVFDARGILVEVIALAHAVETDRELASGLIGDRCPGRRGDEEVVRSGDRESDVAVQSSFVAPWPVRPAETDASGNAAVVLLGRIIEVEPYRTRF